jgi:periplasmic protein CpxP/Spy
MAIRRTDQAAATIVGAGVLGALMFFFPADTISAEQSQQAQVSPPAANPATPPPAAQPSPVRPTRVDRVEARITSLHAQLKITPAQEPQWNAFAQVMRDNAKTVDALIQSRVQNAKTMTAVDDLHAYQGIADAHAEGLKKLIPAFEALYASMSDEQKKNADAVFSQMQRRQPSTKQSG